MTDMPEWINQAVRMLGHKTYRVTAFRLTSQQQDQLEDITGQKDLLFGKQVRPRAQAAR